MNDVKNTTKVPHLPTDIPFNGEQKQWLGGFLAGLHTRLLVKEEGVNNQQTATAVALKPLTIIYGSQTGNAQAVAEDAQEMAKEHGLTVNVIDMEDANLQDLTKCERLLVVTSTYGEGEMPDNAQALWDDISSDSAPSFENSYYSVLALGDTNYDGFCTAGILWDERLQALGAQRIADRVDCDVDFEEPANQWLNEALATIAQKGSSASGEQVSPSQKKPVKSKFNRQNPLSAELITKKSLTQPNSSKETFHYEFSLEESGETYEAGDALNVVSTNRETLVNDLLALFNTSGEIVEPYKGESLTLKDIFTNILEIRTPSKDLIAELALRSGNEKLTSLVNNTNKDALNDFLWGKDTTDLLRLYPQAQFSVAEFIALSKPLAARAYSISSSIKHHAQEVHLTVANVRYKQDDREHHGVCSTFLADKAVVGDKIKCFFSPNKSFSVPENSNAPMIMVGPGTGIAPFRAFLEERVATKAEGDNWLFFGDRNSETDFLYQDEIETMQGTGLLTRLDLAFSRDQSEKIYVQDRMLENAKELFAWLERGAYFFICGDAYRMAKDVDKALHKIIEQQGGLSTQASEEYVNQLKKQKRYVRDVY